VAAAVAVTNGRWRLVTVKGQARARCGWAVLIEHYADDACERWVMHDLAKFREPFG
jgi:hypothetical protein